MAAVLESSTKPGLNQYVPISAMPARRIASRVHVRPPHSPPSSRLDRAPRLDRARPLPEDSGRFYARVPRLVSPLAVMNNAYSLIRRYTGVNLVSFNEGCVPRASHRRIVFTAPHPTPAAPRQR